MIARIITLSMLAAVGAGGFTYTLLHATEMVAQQQSLESASQPLGPLGLPWTAWAVFCAGGIQAVLFAAAMGGLFVKVRTLTQWLSKVAENTEGTRNEVAALKVKLEAIVTSAESDRANQQASNHELRERVGGLEERERARLERNHG